MQPVCLEKLNQMREDFLNSPEKQVRANAVTAAGIAAVAPNYRAVSNTPSTYSVELKTGAVTNQRSSGRCWLFAAMNVLRFDVMHKLNLDTFELSQNYVFFYDKLEKANYFLENILSTLDEPLDGRLMAHLLSAPFQDGGQWDMAVSVIEKYGVVPHYVMPDTFHATSSGVMCKFLTLKAREFAKTLRDAHAAGKSMDELRAMKEEMFKTFYDMLCISLGVPPTTFDFEVRDKDDNFIRDLNLTPKAFYDKYVGKVLSDYISVINAPTADKPYYRTYTVDRLGNVAGGRDVFYLNLPAEALKRMTLAQLKDGEPVWFGSDVGQMLFRDSGLMAMDTFDYGNLLCTRFPLDKAARLDYGESMMTHAMVIMGANEIQGKVNRWKVENSWGDQSGEKGWYRMSDEWFSEYTYQVVVRKSYLTDEEQAALDTAPIVLKPWDPMGSLA